MFTFSGKDVVFKELSPIYAVLLFLQKGREHQNFMTAWGFWSFAPTLIPVSILSHFVGYDRLLGSAMMVFS